MVAAVSLCGGSLNCMGNRRTVAVVAAAFLMMALGGAAAVANPGDKQATQVYPQSAPTHAVTVHDEVGNVTVRRGTPGQVVATKNWLLSEPSVNVTRRGDALDITATCPPNMPVNDCSVDLAVTLPDAFSQDINTEVGDIDVAGTAGTATVQNSVGRARVADVTGDALSVKTGEGSLSATGLDVRRLTAKVDNGDIHIATRTAPDNVDARGENGSVEVAVPAGIYAVTVAVNNGDHDVRGLQVDPNAARKISARTDNGDVLVRSLDASAAPPTHTGSDRGPAPRSTSAPPPPQPDKTAGPSAPASGSAVTPQVATPSNQFAALDRTSVTSRTGSHDDVVPIGVLAVALLVTAAALVPIASRRRP